MDMIEKHDEAHFETWYKDCSTLSGLKNDRIEKHDSVWFERWYSDGSAIYQMTTRGVSIQIKGANPTECVGIKRFGQFKPEDTIDISWEHDNTVFRINCTVKNSLNNGAYVGKVNYMIAIGDLFDRHPEIWNLYKSFTSIMIKENKTKER